MQRHRVPGWVSTTAFAVAIAGLMGLTWAGLMITINGDDPDVVAHLLGGLAYGVVWMAIQLVVARSTRRRYRKRRAALTDEQHDAAAQAIIGGPIPDELPVLDEAIRRARRAPGVTGDHQWIWAAVFGALAAGAAVCAVVINPWLWPAAALCAVVAAIFTRVLVRVPPRLAVLVAAAESLRGSAAADPPDTGPPDATAAICLIAPRPRFSIDSSTELLIDVDGQPRPADWGETTIYVPAGRRELTASVDAPLSAAGRARAYVEATAGEPVRIYYSVPWLLRMRGQLSPVPMPRRGLWALIAVLAAPLVLLAVFAFAVVS